MRLLTLCTYPPMLGGLAVHAQELSEHLAGAGNDVAVVTVDETPGAPRTVVTRDHDVAVVRVAPLPGGARGDLFAMPGQDSDEGYIARFERQNVRASEGLLAHLAGVPGPDLIACHGYFFALSAMSAVRVTGAPMVFHAHNMMAADVGQSAALRDYFAAVESAVLDQADHVIAISDFIADLCADLGCDRRKISVIPKALHMDSWDGRWQPQARPTVLFVGRLSPEKGLETLLAATAELRAEMPEIQVLVAGAGDPGYVRTLRDRVAGTDLVRHVAFLGAVAGAKLPSLYRAASVAVVPSLMEAFGRVAIEAMAAGCPVVVTDVGGLGPLVREGETGRKVPAGDPHKLAGALRDTIADPVAAADRAVRARHEVVATYSWSRVAAATRSVYETTIAGRPS